MDTKYKLALELIKHYEGFHESPYVCPAGVLTVGYGRTTGDLTRKTTKLAEEAWLLDKLLELNLIINRVVKPTLRPAQMASLISLSYNIGDNSFINSSLVKRINKNDVSSATEFLRWNKVRDKALIGLSNRRVSEYVLYTDGKLILI